MTELLKQPSSSAANIFTGVAAVVITGCFIAAFTLEIYWLSAVPAGIMVGLAAFINTRWLYLPLVFMIPFSFDYRFPEMNLNISVPAEPLIGILGIITLTGVFFSNQYKSIVRHPVSITIFFFLFSLLITACFSVMPMVTVKAFVVTLCFIGTFYFLTARIIQTTPEKTTLLWTLYFIGFIGVVLITTYNHSNFGFTRVAAMRSTPPFYNDHTAYGTCSAFLLPILLVLNYNKRTLQLPSFVRFILPVVILLCIVAVSLSYSRAAWFSLFAALGFYIILKLRINFWVLFGTFMGIVMLILIFWNSLLPYLRKNDNDSKQSRARITEQVKSVTNINSDISNLERINRWSCAWRMFKENPVTGWGQGTYQFQYLRYQLSKEMTPISMKFHMNKQAAGQGGTAHSEYLLLLSENGIIAMLCFVAVIFTAFYTGMKVYYTSQNIRFRIIAIALLLALATYIFHASFNNFLDTSKAAFLFWGSIAMLVGMDLYERGQNTTANTK